MPKGEFFLQLRLLTDCGDAAVLADPRDSADPSSVPGQVLAFVQASAYRTTWEWDDDSVKISSEVVLFRCLTAAEVHDLAMAACDAVDLHNERKDRLFRLVAVRMGAACGHVKSANEEHSCFPSCRTVSRAEHLAKAAPPFGICADGATVARMPNKTGGQYGPLRKINGVNGERLTGHVMLFRKTLDDRSAVPPASTLPPDSLGGDKMLVVSNANFRPEVIEGDLVEGNKALKMGGNRPLSRKFFDLVQGNAAWDLLKLLATSVGGWAVSVATNTWWVFPLAIACLLVLLWSVKTNKDNQQ